MKDSEKLSEFLDFLRNCDEELAIACSIQREADEQTQDILHNIELQENSQYDFILEGIELKNVRKKRRDAKNRQKVLTPIVEWYSANSRTIRELEQLLGKVRKEERSTENQIYINRTDIIRVILEGGENDE